MFVLVLHLAIPKMSVIHGKIILSTELMSENNPIRRQNDV